MQQRKRIVADRPCGRRSLGLPGNKTAKVEPPEPVEAFRPPSSSVASIKLLSMFISLFLLKWIGARMQNLCRDSLVYLIQ
jgi:hypothetical protein